MSTPKARAAGHKGQVDCWKVILLTNSLINGDLHMKQMMQFPLSLLFMVLLGKSVEWN